MRSATYEYVYCARDTAGRWDTVNAMGHRRKPWGGDTLNWLTIGT